MAQMDFFDATTVAPQQPFEVIPAGDYLVHIINSDMRPTKDGSGRYLWLEMEILDGPRKGAHLFDRLNLVNANSQAVEIAQRAMSAICHAIGVMRLTDSEQLHFKPMVAKVKVRPAGPDKNGIHRDASNEIGGYSSTQPGAQPGAAQAHQQTTHQHHQPAQQQSSAAAPPWRR